MLAIHITVFEEDLKFFLATLAEILKKDRIAFVNKNLEIFLY
jgi:hypothetical protein